MTVEALWADIGRNRCARKGVGHLERNFQGERASPTNDFWHQKTSVPGLSYGDKKLPKSLTGWVGCTNVTDRRQTDDRQTGDGIANVILSYTFAKNLDQESNRRDQGQDTGFQDQDRDQDSNLQNTRQ